MTETADSPARRCDCCGYVVDERMIAYDRPYGEGSPAADIGTEAHLCWLCQASGAGEMLLKGGSARGVLQISGPILFAVNTLFDYISAGSRRPAPGRISAGPVPPPPVEPPAHPTGPVPPTVPPQADPRPGPLPPGPNDPTVPSDPAVPPTDPAPAPAQPATDPAAPPPADTTLPSTPLEPPERRDLTGQDPT